MMKRFIICLMALMIATGSAWAFDEGYHVKQAPNGKGDLMIFPMYMAAGDWETKITVVNTSSEYSVIAKVIYRSHYWTKELLDHLIYLSPNDVWVGYIRDIGGQPSIYSEDDSILVADAAFATPANPVRQPFFNVNMCAAAQSPTSEADSRERGYVEVVETWYKKTASPIAKSALLAMYNPGTGPVEVSGSAITNQAGYQATTTTTATSHNIDHTINVLTGVMEFQNRNMPNYTAALNATVFADFDVFEYMNVVNPSGLDAITNFRNTLGEVEAALAKDNIAMPYINNVANGVGTIHMFNFPTKQSYDWNTTTGVCRYTPKGPFWRQRPGTTSGTYNQCIVYEGTFYDLSENALSSSDIYSGGTTEKASMCEELQWVVIFGGTYFSEGWQNYDFTTTNNTRFRPASMASNYYGEPVPDATDYVFTGVPVIPFSLYLKGTGMSMFDGASTDGEVYAANTNVAPYPGAADTWLPDYQYWNYMDALGLNNNTGVNNNATATNTVAWYPENLVVPGPAMTFPAQILLP